MARIGASYARATLFANKNPQSLEDFFISRFGRELYLTFFKSYTEKVWGEECAKSGTSRALGASKGCRSPRPRRISSQLSASGAKTFHRRTSRPL